MGLRVRVEEKGRPSEESKRCSSGGLGTGVSSLQEKGSNESLSCSHV